MKKILTILIITTLVYRNDGERWPCGGWNLKTCSNQNCMAVARKMVEKQVGIRVASDHEKIYFLCDNGYTLVGNVDLKCNVLEDTLLSTEIPKCDPISMVCNDTSTLLANATTISYTNKLDDGSITNNVTLYLLVPLILILCVCVYKYTCSKRHTLFNRKHSNPPIVPHRPENTLYLPVLSNSEVDYIDCTHRRGSVCSIHHYDVIRTVEDNGSQDVPDDNK